MIFISDKGTESFLNASPGLISVNDLALCLWIDFLMALDIMIHLGVQVVRLVICIERLLHLADLALNFAYFLDEFAPFTIDTVQLVQGYC